MVLVLGPGIATAGAGTPTVLAGAHFELQVDGQTIGFSEISNISSEVEPQEYIYVDTKGAINHTKQYGKTKPPTVTLKRGLDGNKTLWAWHQLALTGNPKARQDVTISAVTPGSAVQDGQIYTWELHNAWVSKIELAGFKAGTSEQVVETVTLTTDAITIAPGGQSAAAVKSVSRNGVVHLAKGVPNPTTPHGTPAVLNGVSCASSTVCAAVGRERVGGRFRLLVEHWNGSVWSTQSAPMPAGAVGAIFNGVSCASGDQCEAVGAWHDATGATHTLAEAWNGISWTVQSSADVTGAATSALTSVSCASAASCEAVGDATGPRATLAIAESLSGGAWQMQSVPRPTASGPFDTLLSGVSCTSSTACLAVGSNGTAPFAAAFNGATWSLEPPSIPASAASASLSSVSCTLDGICTAVGSLGSTTGGTQALAERWAGGVWSIEVVPQPAGTGASVLTGVSCPAAAACQAVGQIVNPTVGRKLLVYNWNGTAWSKVVSPDPADERATRFSGVSCVSGASCAAVGGALKPTPTAVMELFASP